MLPTGDKEKHTYHEEIIADRTAGSLMEPKVGEPGAGGASSQVDKMRHQAGINPQLTL